VLRQRFIPENSGTHF